MTAQEEPRSTAGVPSRRFLGLRDVTHAPSLRCDPNEPTFERSRLVPAAVTLKAGREGPESIGDYAEGQLDGDFDMKCGWLAATLGVSACLFASDGLAEVGVTDSTIKIGSCAALEGPARFLGTETVRGAQAYLRLKNEQGGVHGRSIELVSYDDGYEPNQTIQCVRKLIEDEKVFSLGFFVGTPTAAKAVPMATRAKVPIVGLFTGAEILRSPVKRYVINVRASYYDETRTMVEKLTGQLGLQKIAVFYQQDAFGQAVLKGVQLALSDRSMKPHALATYERNTMNVEAGVEKIAASGADAVVMVGTYAPLSKYVKLSRERGFNPLFLNVSFIGTEAFAEDVGSAGDGVVITQVVPPPDQVELEAVKLYRDALARYGEGGKPNFVSFEGFIDAMVLVEAIERTGPNLTREGLIETFEGMQGLDLGIGEPVSFSTSSHQGLKKVFPTFLQGGKARVIQDWRQLGTSPAAPH